MHMYRSHIAKANLAPMGPTPNPKFYSLPFSRGVAVDRSDVIFIASMTYGENLWHRRLIETKPERKASRPAGDNKESIDQYSWTRSFRANFISLCLAINRSIRTAACHRRTALQLKCRHFVHSSPLN